MGFYEIGDAVVGGFAEDFAEDFGGGGRKSYDLGDFLYHGKLRAGLGDDVKRVGHFGGFFRVGCPPCC